MLLKKLSVALLSLSACSLFAAELSNYNAIADAIKNDGTGIRIVMNWKECQSEYPISIDAIGNYMPDAIMAIEGKYVTFSSLHFTMNEPRHKGIPLYESTKYTLTPDNKLTMTSIDLHAKTFEAMGSSITTVCNLGEGVKFYSTK